MSLVDSVRAMDKNPRFNEDIRFRNDSAKVRDLLWETVGPNFSEMPAGYLATLRHEYSNGRVSMCEVMDRVDLGPEATYEDYCEVFDRLLDCDPNEFPDPDSVLEVKTEHLLAPAVEEFSEESFNFVEDEDISHKIEMFLRKVLASSYTDGVSGVSDEEGNPPNESNNYLLSVDGTKFSGVFYDRDSSSGKTKRFPFTISQKGKKWQVTY